MNQEHEPTKYLLPIDEAEKKRYYMRIIDVHWKKNFSKFSGLPDTEFKPLPQAIIATIMAMDLDTLRSMAHNGRTLDEGLMALCVMPCFIKIMMIKNRSDDDEIFTTITGPTVEAKGAEIRAKEELFDKRGADKEDKCSVSRSEKEKRERARLDDYRCVILRKGMAEVCHIVPFSVNSTEECRSRMAKYFPLAVSLMFPSTREHAEDTTTDLDSDDVGVWVNSNEKLATECLEFFTLKMGVSDKAWNEISLGRQLYRWWSEGFLAFEPQGIDHTFSFEDDTYEEDDTGKGKSEAKKKTITRVKLRFHWMPRRKDTGSAAPQVLTTGAASQGPKALESMLGKTYGDLGPSNPFPSRTEFVPRRGDTLDEGFLYLPAGNNLARGVIERVTRLDTSICFVSGIKSAFEMAILAGNAPLVEK
ncbi:hypothetical protein OQA88_7122 [Cercophora sp. LCS_1]